MAEFPAMPFWFDAYWRDTAHLTNEEHGLYLKLISLLWHAPGQRIPNDPKWISRRFKEDTPKALELIYEFCFCDGNWIMQSKVRREFQYVAEKREKQRDRIKCRWDKEKDSYRGSTVVIPPTPTPNKKESKKEEVRKKKAINGNGVWVGEMGKKKPRHRQTSKQGRIWLDAGTDDFNAYASDYWDKHHAAVPLLWHDSGAWFNTAGEVD